QKLTEHEGCLCARDYDDVTQEFVVTAVGDYQAHLCAEGPMPNHAQETALLNASWAKACQITGINLVFPHWLPCYATSCIQITICGELKGKVHPLVEVIFNFHSSQMKSAIKKNHTLVEELKEGANFAFKVQVLLQDDRHGFLKAPIIQKIINMMWFANKTDEGIKNHTWFKPFPLPALVLVLTAIECCIDEWMTGMQMDIPFTIQDYCGRYNSHLKCLQDFDEATKEFGVLKGICARISKDSVSQSKVLAALATQPQNVVSAEIIAAAIKEHQEGLTTEDESDN
ncbi:hypothetical protein SCLCIDRAFT_131091, partial [Scleroderma citrinum Foug A]